MRLLRAREGAGDRIRIRSAARARTLGENLQRKQNQVTKTSRERAVLLAFSVVGLGALASAPLTAAPPVNKPAPAFSAPTVDTNKPVSLAAYKGKSGVLLNFYSNT